MKPSLVLAGALTLHHRLYHPALPTHPFTERGTIHPDDDAPILLPSPNLSADWTAFADVVAQSPDNLYYQLALQRDDQDQSTWDFASVKACHLPQVTSQKIILHLQDARPFAVDYYLSPVPHDGSCPKSRASSEPPSSLAEYVQKLNTTIIFELPRTLPLPELHKPPPLTPTGDPVQPPPEKSFIQKYWMYMAIILVAFAFTGGEEEGPRRQAQA
ncbi:hypothetical protein Agabi119p4_4422 [Agaricus bisporus var. burnettii]|uniref:ER membrane protein complex subunit 10 n=1 Tax=Agaricus bisporus var. burnettii TaxID=192524 RepID=A0A8H7F3A0_AGABI|nr:hypothetical protein Agabi119p4_4422 [Agaricus bisporus var. burnettii]